MCGGWLGEKLGEVEDTAKNVAKVVVGGVEKVADDFLGIDDSGGIVGSVSKIGEKIEDGLREAVDEVDKAIENPYVRLAISIAYPPAAPYLSAYATLDSGEELSPAQIAALAASAGQDFGAFEAANIDPEIVDQINKGVQVATADNPGEAFILAYGTDIAQETGITEAFDNTIATNFGQETLDVLKQNEDYIVDTARFASGDMSEQELVAKYGAGAVDYATSGTAAEDYSKYLADAINVGVGNTTIEEVVANRYGEDIVNYLGAETDNERAIGLGGLTTATQLAMGTDPLDAAYAGTKRAYDEGARIEDLSFVPQQVAGIDLNIGDMLPDLGIDFEALKGRGYDIPSLADINVNLGKFNFTAPDVLGVDLSLPEVADLGVDLGRIDFSGMSTEDLGVDALQLKDLGVDLGQLNLNPEWFNIGLALATETIPGSQVTRDGEEIASLTSEFDISPSDEPLFSREVLGRSFT